MASAPKPPDPFDTAAAQSNANTVAAQQNFGLQNVNEYSPYGSKTYAQTGNQQIWDANAGKYINSPTYSSTVNLSPEEQRLLDQNTAMRGNLGALGVSQSRRLQGVLGKEMDTSGVQGWQAAAAPGEIRQDQTPTDRKAIEDAMMQRYSRYADPQNAAQDVQMSLRGLEAGSQGYGSMKQGQNDAYTNAINEAYLGSGAESRAAEAAFNAAAQQKYQLGADWASQLNNLRQGQMTEKFALRNQPMNEIMALMGGSGPNTPQFQPFQGSSVQAPNIGQYIYDDYNARAQQSANDMSGMFGVGSAVAGALPWASWLGAAAPLAAVSDRRLKQDIEPYGSEYAGVPLYWFRYKDMPEIQQVGVMADEVRRVHPDAVVEVDGYDRVNYDILRRRHKD